MKNNSHQAIIKQSGATLVESLAVIAIMSSVVAGMMYWVDIGLEDMKSQQAAQYQQRFVAGVQKFISDPTQNALVKSTATTTVPVKVQIANLTAGNFVQAGTGARNSYNQAGCALIYYDSAANRVSALVTTEGGNAIPEGQLPYVAANAGDGGGFVSTLSPTVAKGAFGSWSVNLASFTDATAAKNCTGTPATGGRLATILFQEANGTLQSEFLYREQVSGRPDLNTMNTPLILGASTIQTVGGACGTTAALARNAQGAVVSCVSGVWTKAGGSQYWGDPVANFASLPVCNAANVNETRVAQAPDVGYTPRAYTCNGAGAWLPLGLDRWGNLALQGTKIVAAGAEGTYGATTVQGTKNSYSGVEFRNSDGSYVVNMMANRGYTGFYDAAAGRWWQQSDVSGNMTLDQTADYNSGRINPGWGVETWGCTTGQISKAAYTVADGWAWNGKTLQCVSGVWKTLEVASGIRGVFYPLRGRTAECRLGDYVYHAYIDGSGAPHYAVRLYHAGHPGWTFGSGATFQTMVRNASLNPSPVSIQVTPGGVVGTGFGFENVCDENWYCSDHKHLTTCSGQWSNMS